jgi:predicted secreted protein
VKKLRKKNRNRIKVKGLVIAFLVSLAFSVVVCPCAGAASMWSRTYGGTGNDSGWGDLIQTSDGGYAISGDTYSFGAGGSDYWLIKTDAEGNMQWNKTYGGTSAEAESAMCQTIDGGYALAGYTSSFGAGGNDFWLVKTDGSGNMQWNKTYGGTDGDLAYSVVATSDGGYAIIGYTNSFGAGGQDAYLVKTNSSGDLQWNKTYGGTGGDVAYSVVATSDGGYAISGYTDSFGAGSNDFWLFKTDAAGNMQWNQTYGGTGGDTEMYLIQTVEGGYALAGYTSSFGAGGNDFWLVKTDASGNMEWNQTYGGTGTEWGIHVIQTEEGGYAIIGYTNSFGAGGNDVWLVKTDADGNMQWNQTYGGTSSDAGWSLIQTIDGGYAIAGNTHSFGAGVRDFYFLKTDELGVIPEDLTIGVMLLLSTVATLVGIRILRKRSEWKRW